MDESDETAGGAGIRPRVPLRLFAVCGALILALFIWGFAAPASALALLLSMPWGAVSLLLLAFLGIAFTLGAALLWWRDRATLGRALSIALVLAVAVLGLGPIGTATVGWKLRDGAHSVFQQQGRAAPESGLWNIALLGSDWMPDRGDPMIDSFNVLSIDVASGSSTLFTVPRGVQQVPIPEASVLYPVLGDTDDCGPPCTLSSLFPRGEKWYAPQFANATFAGTTPGIEAVRDGLSGVLGIPVHNAVVFDIFALEEVIDAVGGVTVEVAERLPIGGDAQGNDVTGWVESGQRRLNGYEATWFVRSRMSTSEADRSARQSQLVRAVAEQIGPLRLLLGMNKIIGITEDHVRTDLMVSDLPLLLRLVRGVESMEVVALEGALGDLSNPDYSRAQAEVVSRQAAESLR